jgi:hypothetical protein
VTAIRGKKFMAISKLKRARLTEKLVEQFRFMQRSCEAFDKGLEDEAIRIATSLRIIFHNTNASTSLTAHLGFGGKRMLSSSPGHGDWKNYLALQIDLTSPQPVKMLPRLGNKFRELSINDWWRHEPVFIYNSQEYSRQRIVLSAANRDGGAHVDEELEKFYEYLCSGEDTVGITGNLQFEGNPPFPQGVTIYPKNAHLSLIRQFAHETIASVNHFNWLGTTA